MHVNKGKNGPTRTCVGCRQRESAAELFRIAVVLSEESAAGERVQRYRLVPDVARNRPGRGAWLHLRSACLVLAMRRNAFTRAFRVSKSGAGRGFLFEEVTAYLDAHGGAEVSRTNARQVNEL